MITKSRVTILSLNHDTNHSAAPHLRLRLVALRAVAFTLRRRRIGGEGEDERRFSISVLAFS
jgi:hypothetical protein